MKKLTEFKELTDREAKNIKDIHTYELVQQHCPHNVAVELADIYIETLTARAKDVSWPTALIFEMERKYGNSDDLSKPLH